MKFDFLTQKKINRMKNSNCNTVKTRQLSCRKLFLGMLFLVLSSSVMNAQQHVVHTGEFITIKPSTDLYLFGDFDSRSTVNSEVLNEGVFHLQGNLIHNGQQNLFGATPNTGTLRFFGNPATNATITGNAAINLKNLTIDLTSNITGGGNVLLRKNGVTAFGDVSFTNGGFELDTYVFNLFHDVSSISSGIIAEANGARPYIGVSNPIGKISLLNYAFPSGSTYTNLKGMGLSFTQDDPLGGTPVLHRTFDTLDCGDTYGSILRAFRIEGNANPAQFSSTKIKFLNGSELGTNPNGTNLNVFVSEDNGQVWRPKTIDIGTSTQVNSIGSTVFSTSPNYTVITAATPCGSVVPIEINQIITGVTPNDTLFDINQAYACDFANVSARLYAVGDAGVYFEWRSDLNNFYSAQTPPGYFEATAIGKYWVRSTNIRGCRDSMSIDVYLSLPSNSNFTTSPSSVCLGSSISFAPNTTVAGATYSWDFGDGNTANATNTSHTYAAIGVYTVTLNVTTLEGCVASSTSSVTIKDIPNPDFIAGSACPGAAVNFDNNSSVVGLLGTVDLDWNFGDGNIGNSQGNQNGSGGTGDVSHVYAAEGTYSVTLTATANGCTSDPFIATVTVYPVPTTSFTISNACAGQSITFTNSSDITDNSTLTYVWDFTGGGGPTSNTTSPVYTYPVAGNYAVSLTATSVNGCVTTINQLITIYQNPVAAFSVTNACVNDSASFADITPEIVGSTPYTYAWTFGDGNVGSLQNISNLYAVAGTYNVAMTVTTANGCVGSTTNSVTIFTGPSVSFSALSACANSPINFINTTSNATSYLWNFPSLSLTATSQNTTQTFPTDGTFPVNLTATSSNGCQGTFNGNITVFALPVVNLGSTITTCGTTYTLDANPGGVNNGCNFQWGTGDITPQYVCTYDDNFSVTVTSGNGCVTTDNVDVTLNGVVLPTLGPNATFCDIATLDAGYPGSTYTWSTTETTQTINVTVSGTYSVTVIDQNSCTGSNSVTITIVPATPVSFGADITACSNNPVTLNAGLASSYLWSDGSTGSTLLVPSSGYYWVQNTNAGGCSSSDTVQVTYNNAPVFTLGADATACDALLLNEFLPNSTYLWNASATTPSFNVTSSGTYTLTITSTLNGCSETDAIIVTINDLPIVNLGNDTSLCSYATGVIDAGNTGSTFQWNSGQTTQTISVAATGNYLVTVTDVNGCTSSDNLNVTMLPLFSIELGPDKQFCNGSSILLDAGLTTIGNTYVWEDETGIIGTNATYSVLDTGMHYLTVTDANTCIAEDSVNITPSNISLFAFFLADSDIIQGDAVVFVNLSYPRPYTSQWYIDNTFITNDSMPTFTFNQPVTPPSDTIYVKLKVDNVFCQSEITKPIVLNSAFQPTPGTETTPVDNGLFTSIRNSNLYPNPNNGVFNFYIDLTQESPAEISVFTVTGAMVYSEKRTLSTNLLAYDFSHLERGIYFLRVGIYNEYRTHKFIIIR